MFDLIFGLIIIYILRYSEFKLKKDENLLYLDVKDDYIISRNPDNHLQWSYILI